MISNYERAAATRKRGVLGTITSRLTSGQGIGQSIGGGISESFKARTTGLKEKFDPLNIAKMFTGNLGMGLLGKITGRSPEDMTYFANKGRKKGEKEYSVTRPQETKVGNVETAFYTTIREGQRSSLQKGDNVATVAAKLANTIKFFYEKENLNRELEHNFEEEIESEDQRRHDNLIAEIKKLKDKRPTKVDIEKTKKDLKIDEGTIKKPEEPKETGKPADTSPSTAAVATTAVAAAPVVSRAISKVKEIPAVSTAISKVKEVPGVSTAVNKAKEIISPEKVTPKATKQIPLEKPSMKSETPTTPSATKIGAGVSAGATLTGIAATFIGKEEGVATKGYWDPPEKREGVSIGYGHLIKEGEYKQGYILVGDEKIPIKGEKGIDTTITKEQAKKLFQQDLPIYEQRAKDPLGSSWEKLNENQKAALTSYAYNVGSTKDLVQKGLKDAIDRGDMIEASKIIENRGIRTSSGKFNSSLDKRRKKEAELFRSDLKTEAVSTIPSMGQRLSETSTINQDLKEQVPVTNIAINNTKTVINAGVNRPRQVISTSQVDDYPLLATN